MKKMLAVLFASLLILAACCAWAEGMAELPPIYTSGDYQYMLLEDGTAEIVSYRGTEHDLILPAEIDGYRVTGLRSHYGNVGFAWRSARSITIPDSVVHLPTNPFISCDTLTNIHVSPDHPVLEVRDGILFDKIEKRLISCPARLPIEHYSVPSDVCAIGDYAFAGCMSLEHIILPEGLTTIGNSAFRACSHLSGIDLPEGVTSIGDYAFFRCDLNEINLPEGVISIGERAFFGCGAFHINLPSSLTSIGPYALGDNNMWQITIPESVTFIGEWAFSGCFSLEIIVTEGSYAEQWCYLNHLYYLYPDDVT